ncbi:MAG: DMT family transporter [Coxiellaceae bacterium]|nr:DMT family transporter [Coxiellaceae bacterium]
MSIFETNYRSRSSKDENFLFTELLPHIICDSRKIQIVLHHHYCTADTVTFAENQPKGLRINNLSITETGNAKKTLMQIKSLSPQTLLAILITVLSWSSSFVFIRLSLQDYSPGALALFRYLIVSVVMLIFYLRLKKRNKPTKSEAIQLFLLGFFGIGLYMIALNYGEVTQSASITSFIIGLNPIVAMLWAYIFMGEQINYKRWLGVLISVIGLAVIALGQFHHDKLGWGILIILFAVVCAGTYNVAQKPLLSTFHPIEVAAISAWVGTTVMLVFTPSMLHEIPKATWQATSGVIYLGIVPGAIGYAAWSYAVSGVKSASRLSLVLYTLPLLTTLLGWLMLGETPSLFAFTGGCIALLGALVATRY